MMADDGDGDDDDDDDDGGHHHEHDHAHRLFSRIRHIQMSSNGSQSGQKLASEAKCSNYTPIDDSWVSISVHG